MFAEIDEVSVTIGYFGAVKDKRGWAIAISRDLSAARDEKREIAGEEECSRALVGA